MKKKLFIFLLSIISVVCLVVGLSACGDSTTDEKSSTSSSGQTDDSSADNTSDDDSTSDKENNDDKSNTITITVYIGGEAAYAVTTDESADYKITLETPEYITTDTSSEVYFAGWYLDGKYTIDYNEDTQFTEDSAVYAKMLMVYVNDFTYTINNAKATITGFTNSTATEVVIPTYLNTFPVTAIGDGAFTDMTMIRTLYLPDGIETIDDNAFYNCNSMSKIIMPDSITSIGSNAFYNCALLESITIPKNVTSIGDRAFYNCNSLTKINYNASAMNDLDDYLIYIYSTGFSYNGIFGNVVQKGNGITVNIGTNVTKIPTYLFYKATNVANVIFEYSSLCTEIGEYAFYGCISLTNIELPDSVTQIGNYAFSGCTALTNINLPANVATIGSSAFHNCTALTNITIPDNVTSIESSAFSGCTALSNINLPANITTIGSSAFSGCTVLSNIEIPANVTTIGSSAFYNCTSLTNITIPNNVTTIGGYVFSGCTAEIIWGNSPIITTIGNYAFSNYKGTSVTLPDSVTSIGSYAFSDCTVLASFTISSGITTVDSSAFNGCTSLTDITVDSNNLQYKSVDGNIYSYDDTTIIRYAPGKQQTSFTIPETVTCIGEYAFYGSEALQTLSVPNSVKEICEYAFASCSKLKNVTTYNNTTSAKSLRIIGGETCEEVNYNSAFYMCTALKSVVLPESLATIGGYDFGGCTSLKSIVIGSNVTSIGESAFINCSALTAVYYTGTAEQWGIISIEAYNTYLTEATVYFYSEIQPTESGNYWHYVNGEVVVWKDGTASE